MTNKSNYTGYIASDHQLLQIIDSALASAAERAGSDLACYAGCAVCCFGPFPITMTDAARLESGLATLAQQEPTIAESIANRAEAARNRLLNDGGVYFADRTGVLRDGLDEAAFAARFSDLACPALDPNSGCCQLYEARPIACRTYGLPTRIDGVDHPHCPLCFRRASLQKIETSRAVLDLTAWRQSLKPEELSRHPSRHGQTVIAFALPPFRRAS